MCVLVAYLEVVKQCRDTKVLPERHNKVLSARICARQDMTLERMVEWHWTE